MIDEAPIVEEQAIADDNLPRVDNLSAGLLARRWIPIALIVVVAAIVYLNSFKGQFIFDDNQIRYDHAITTLWPPWHSMLSRYNIARPLVGLTFALNFAVSAFKVWSYHLFNLVIHVLAALTLYAVAKRTLETPHLIGRFGKASAGLALAIAMIWAVHPLQTESVTYIIQRAEALMGLFYLLTLYCAIRGFESGNSWRWYAAAMACAAAGMASKPVMATAPLMVLAWDSVFKSDSIRAALRKHSGLYAGLAASWVVVIGTVIAAAPLNRSAGFSLERMKWWAYLPSQFVAIGRYLKLSLWPYGLCLDYSLRPPPASQVIPYAILVVLLAIATVVALIRKPEVGFLGLWFFLILAPTSSFMPLLDIMVEHRMYLPLAAVIALLVTGVYRLRDLLANRGTVLPGWLLPAALAIGVSWLGSLTVERNALYHSDALMWADVVKNAPWNPRGHCNYGLAIYQLGRADEASSELEQAIAIRPTMAEAQNGLGHILLHSGRPAEAIPYFERARSQRSDLRDVNFNLGSANRSLGNWEEAASAFRRELQINPEDLEAYRLLAEALEKQNKIGEAARVYREALRQWPNLLEMLCRLTLALTDPKAGDARDVDGAIEVADRALELTGHRQAWVLDIAASAYASGNRFEEAVAMARKALDLARAQGDQQLADLISKRLAGYQTGRVAR